MKEPNRDDLNDDLNDEIDTLDGGVIQADSLVSEYFGSSKDVVGRHNHCVICGGHLHFSHLTDFSRNMTQESSKCPECGIQIRRVMHRLQ